jgi:outer membrane protein OmpA-like peptidoglycan-associated protein
MRTANSILVALMLCASAARSQSASDPKEFVLHKSDHTDAKDPKKGKVKPSATEAALRLSVVDKETSAGIKGVVVCVTGPDGKKHYTDETDASGYTELLVPISQMYAITYLSLGRSDFTAKANVDDRPNHNINLTLRYQRQDGPPRVVLDGVYFDTGKADLRPESIPRLDNVVEYMTHKKSVRIEISGHTDNVGNAKSNKELSQRRAQTCRDYLVSKGIDAARLVAVGYGQERPIATNDTDEGRQQNRRIEATEL